MWPDCLLRIVESVENTLAAHTWRTSGAELVAAVGVESLEAQVLSHNR